MQNQLYEMLLKEDEITWQTIIYDLIKTEQMDPWDIDISILTNEYIKAIKTLKDMNFFISGKVLLAASLLLRIKSTKLVTEDIAAFDNLLFNPESEEIDDYIAEEASQRVKDIPKLAIKTPQARKRRLTVQDLVDALQKALEVNQRKVIRKVEERSINVQLPKVKIDITNLIKNVYQRILDLFKKEDKVTFTKIVSSDKKEDKIYTFIPLLHLDNQGKINLIQEKPFGEIEIIK
ncbi:segregation/condensation protein A [Candidatus Woesearchaeota archaeon]|nr:segregation/condensation protein A [Candidatus Woesearchaeota archaeon]